MPVHTCLRSSGCTHTQACMHMHTHAHMPQVLHTHRHIHTFVCSIALEPCSRCLEESSLDLQSHLVGAGPFLSSNLGEIQRCSLGPFSLVFPNSAGSGVWRRASDEIWDMTSDSPQVSLRTWLGMGGTWPLLFTQTSSVHWKDCNHFI